jgi:chromosome segregation ATPase
MEKERADRDKQEIERSEARRVEADAFERARRFYDDVIQRLDADLKRVTEELQRVRVELDREKTVSDDLRQRLRGMEDTIHDMRQPLQELKEQAEQQTPQRFFDLPNGGFQQ